VPAFSVSKVTTVTQPETPAPTIVIGFVGGFVRHGSLKHGPVQLAQRLQREVPKSSSYVEMFENRHRKKAYKTILRLLDANHDGVLSQREKERARIILFGHSWGAAAVVMLARDLRRAGIPVLLTVQVDSVAKLWQSDSVIPDNVAEAVNYYQPHGIVHGRAKITAADPSKTQILGNYRVDYRKDPVACGENSWYDRFFTPGHVQSECDPRVWSQIEEMVKERIAPETKAAASMLPPLAGRTFQQNVVDEPGTPDKGSNRY
jgi:pimeloyl-ACP methyl ester carboxylesterase